MKTFNVFHLILICLIVSACNNEKRKTEPEVVTVQTTPEKKVYTAAEMESEFKDSKVKVIFEEYIVLKMALVNTNSENTALAAKSLYAKLQAIDADADLITVVQAMSETSDVEVQRKAFVKLTAGVESMLEGGLKSGKIYKQFCPMAFNNTGAYWLSNSKDIQNPYFGDKMLKCGRVAAEIQ